MDRAPSLSQISMPALVRTLSPGRLAKFAPTDARKIGLAYESDLVAGAGPACCCAGVG